MMPRGPAAGLRFFRDRMSPEQRAFLDAAVTLFVEQAKQPTTELLMEVLNWPRDRVERVGEELKKLGAVA